VSARIGNSSHWFCHTAAPRQIFAAAVTTVVITIIATIVVTFIVTIVVTFIVTIVVTINTSQLRCAGHAVIDGIVYVSAHMVLGLTEG
jgi:ABC-type transport system involved in multi-copper enzyme maturation permease subunit